MSQPSLPDISTASSAAPNTLTRRSRAGLGWLCALCFALFFWRLGSVPLFDLDEALYVTCARQMVLTGDIVTPRLNSRPLDRPTEISVPFYEKPILVYWLSALSLRLFGLTEWAARLPVAFAALLATGIVVWAGGRQFGRRAGLLAGLVYATAPMTILDARQMTTDGLLVLWLTGALLAFFACHHAIRMGQKPPLLPACLFWFCCALAILTKGAVGLLLPALVISVFLWLRRFPVWRISVADGWPSVRALRPLLGLLACLALVAPWHILIWKAGGRDGNGRTWAQEYVLRQHINRFKGGDKVHNAPPPTYLLYFLIGFFPWACFAPAAFRFSQQAKGTTEAQRHRGCTEEDENPRRTRRDTKEDEEDSEAMPLPTSVGAALDSSVAQGNEAVPPSDTEREFHRFLLVWFGTIFVFFSLGAAKLPTYIVPAYPAAALLVGRWLDRVLDAANGEGAGARSLRQGAFGAAVTAGLLVTAVALAPRFAPAQARVPAEVERLALTVTLTLLAGSVIAFLCFLIRKDAARWRMAGVGALAGTIALFTGFASTQGYAVAKREALDPYQQLAAAARPDAQAGLPVVFYNIVPRRPSMLYYAGYSPLERKETPLLPFLRRFLTPAQPAADVITSRRSWEQTLQPEIAAAPDVAARLLRLSDDSARTWVLLRIEPQRRKGR